MKTAKRITAVILCLIIGMFPLCIAASADDTQGIAISAENFPDEAFRKYISEQIDTDTDGYLSENEINNTKAIDFEGHYINIDDYDCLDMVLIDEIKKRDYTDFGDIYKNVASVKGIENFTALTVFNCNNTKITELDLSYNTSLEKLYCSGTPLVSLDITNTKITYVDLSDNTSIHFINGNGATILVWHRTYIFNLFSENISPDFAKSINSYFEIKNVNLILLEDEYYNKLVVDYADFLLALCKPLLILYSLMWKLKIS